MRDRLERLWVKTRLSLPTALLRGMSGGAAVVRGGRTLDPRLQYLSHVLGRRAAGAELTPDDARMRDARETDLLASPPLAGVARETLTMAGPTGAGLELRAYTPAAQHPERGVILYAHAGGGVIGDLDSGAGFCDLLAKTTATPVVSVNYRLSPEHHFPAACEDVAAAYDWLQDQGSRFGAAPGRVSVAGASIGGGFAAALCQDLKARGRPQPLLQILLYPLLDLTDPTLRNPASYEYGWPLSLVGMAWSRNHYLGPQADAGDPRLTPGRSADLVGLAPAVIATGGFDPLRDQAQTYALALKAAGGRVDFRLYDGMTHDFAAFAAVIPPADAACREIARLAAQALSDAVEG